MPQKFQVKVFHWCACTKGAHVVHATYAGCCVFRIISDTSNGADGNKNCDQVQKESETTYYQKCFKDVTSGW